MPRGLAVTWSDGTTLAYNASFARAQPAGRRSHSLPLHPDIVLEVSSGPIVGLHLFDAKFKLEQIENVLLAGMEDAVEAEERRGTFTRGDLHEMHACRDAIPRAASVWILYPDTELRFFATSGTLVGDAAELPAALVGVGAVALRPDADGTAGLRSVLARLLAGPS